ncbi:response regulator [Geotalea uraniireducens]|uniref:Response regulator n=1 Tax=Geotalea uraniireducens TaxID=351604 RepID=A0ABM8EJM2_9BACT|nr:response regulator [Geotalea uraniireducens]BDV42576.1 response regulator [Geotalea uraniireducens]
MKKILVAEDSATMRSLLVETVESLGGFQAIEAASGFEALRLLPREALDLIITDINMPDINGLELVSFVRQSDIYRHIPIFIVSTEGSQRDRDKGLALGANEYVVKPFDPRQLQELIVKYLP